MALDPKLTKFTTASPLIATFDFQDVAEGTGVIVFLGSDTDDNGTVTYQLSRNALYSQNIMTVGSGTSGVEKILDVDFDVTFNFPKDVKGKVIANIPLVIGNDVTVLLGGSAYIVVQVRKWDGSTESDIASNTKSETSPAVGSGDTLQLMFNVEVDTPLTHFAAGETLRITVEGWAAVQNANGLQMGLMHDPKNRTPTSADYSGGFASSTFLTSILSFNVPFLINT